MIIDLSTFKSFSLSYNADYVCNILFDLMFCNYLAPKVNNKYEKVFLKSLEDEKGLLILLEVLIDACCLYFLSRMCNTLWRGGHYFIDFSGSSLIFDSPPSIWPPLLLKQLFLTFMSVIADFVQKWACKSQKYRWADSIPHSLDGMKGPPWLELSFVRLTDYFF